MHARLWALVGEYLPLLWRPWIYLLGWACAVAIFVKLYLDFCFAFLISQPVALASLVLILLQPSNGDYFNLSNCHFWIGLGLILHLFQHLDTFRRTSKLEFSLILIAALTGPHSLFLAPLLLFYRIVCRRSLLSGDLIALTLGAAVQTLFLISSRRLELLSLNQDLSLWIKTIKFAARFGTENLFLKVMLAGMWLAFFFYLIKIYRNEKHLRKFIGATFFIAFCYTFSGLYINRSFPPDFVSTAGGTRYTTIQYSLFIVLASVLLRGRAAASFLFFAILSFSFISKIQPLERDNLHFMAYVKLAKTHKTFIPINPNWGWYPGWHIPAFPNESENADASTVIVLNKIKKSSTFEKIENLDLQPVNGTASIEIPVNSLCKTSTEMGLIVEGTRSSAGWAQLSWDHQGFFFPEFKHSRWFPENEPVQMFAFSFTSHPQLLRLSFEELAAPYNLKSLRIVCL